MNLWDRITKQANLVILAYLALLLVMGGRTALFVSNFDNLLVIDIFGGNITGLSILLAVALMLGVAGTAWRRVHYKKGSVQYRTATATMIGAVVLDGAFNVSEAIMLATEAGTIEQYTGPVQWWLWFTVGLVGIGPTLLTVGLASLAGSVDYDVQRQSAKRRRRTSNAVQSSGSSGGHSVERNEVLDEHLASIGQSVNAGETFRREDVEEWTGLAKGQSVNVLNYGRQIGLIESPKRGHYVLTENGEH